MTERGFLANLQGKMRALPKRFWDDTFLVVAIFLISLAAFGLGRLSVLSERDGSLEIIYPEGQESAAVLALPETGEFVASISGSKYHLPWCPGAKSIKDENKIWFTSREEAEISGYTPAVNCPGI